MTTIAIYNIKGGVGKTATAVNIAYLASLENNTLLCDLDPQGGSSYYMRARPKKKYGAKQLLKGGNKLENSIRGTDFQQFDLLPADLSLRNLDIELDNKKRSRTRLQETLEPFQASYPHIFLDSPPNITLLSENIFLAADLILIPLIPTSLSMMSYEKLLDFLTEEGFDTQKVLPFFSMVEKRKKMHRGFVKENAGKRPFMKTTIPYSSEVEKMGIYRAPLPWKQPGSIVGKQYKCLWDELKCYI
jgi:cellulose biosynthesis protein BcsQ